VAINTGSKLTEEQINENVQKLMQDVYIGNGEPSIRQMVRDTAKRMDEVHDLLQAHIDKWEKKEQEHMQEKISMLTQHQDDQKQSKTFWTRTVGVLVLTQLLSWFFIFLAK
jgi:hypothetical protein